MKIKQLIAAAPFFLAALYIVFIFVYPVFYPHRGEVIFKDGLELQYTSTSDLRIEAQQIGAGILLYIFLAGILSGLLLRIALKDKEKKAIGTKLLLVSSVSFIVFAIYWAYLGIVHCNFCHELNISA